MINLFDWSETPLLDHARPIAARALRTPPSAVRQRLHPTDVHFRAMLDYADEIDRQEGQRAYLRYHRVMIELARHYEIPLPLVTAAFVSLSPNNDYTGNLRSTVSCLLAHNHNIHPDRVVVSTYNHCKLRAMQCLAGARHFAIDTRGLKILNFYYNVLDPTDPTWVTIDGHMVGAWQGLPLVMKEALISRRDYQWMKAQVCELARERGLLPNQLQAMVWFARRRQLRKRYNPQIDLIDSRHDDLWNTEVEVSRIEPFAFLAG